MIVAGVPLEQTVSVTAVKPSGTPPPAAMFIPAVADITKLPSVTFMSIFAPATGVRCLTAASRSWR